MIRAYFDGLCNPNPNRKGFLTYLGCILNNDNCIHSFYVPSQIETIATNFSAYYLSIIEIFQFLISRNLVEQEINIYGCAELVVKQMQGESNIGGGQYKPYADKAFTLLPNFIHLNFHWLNKNDVKKILYTEGFIQ
jgi:ribonuclease HI